MVIYTVAVKTGDRTYSGTFCPIFMVFQGVQGESDKTYLTGGFGGFSMGSNRKLEIKCEASLGKLLLVKVYVEPFKGIDDKWFCDKISVITPEGDEIMFPCYRWLACNEKLVLRPAKALLKSQDTNPVAQQERRRHLEDRRETFRWSVYARDTPHITSFKAAIDLPHDLHFSFTKEVEMTYMQIQQIRPKALGQDEFFGYQFLNGLNPMVIQRCSKLPENFHVTEEMVKDSLYGHTLEHEMKKGNIFLCDYKMLDKLIGNVLNDEQQYLTAPLVLLHCNYHGKMLPIAIQLMQTPGHDNPIFLPTDSKHDWLLAKIFVRAAEFSVHELDVHLLRTHLMAEVFTMATLRNLPTMHPLYKLLFPHTRYTLHINIMARNKLISGDGFFKKYTAIGGDALVSLLKRATKALTYSSLCLPENISERGLEDVPNYYYRDDGMRLWNIINKYVEGVLQHYYKSDEDVQEDTELQSWIREIFNEGFLKRNHTGIPHSFQTVWELIRFVTMVIFTVSAQHAAVNNGQFDFGGWMPNSPTTLRKPPPKKKGQTTEETILETLPDVGTTVNGMAALELLSTISTDHYPLGCFPEELFDEDVPCNHIKDFQAALKKLSSSIEERNKNMKLPYIFLNPVNVDNSVAI